MAKRITKTDVNFWLDTFLLCVFLVLCWISVVLRYAFPTVSKTAGWTLWGLDYAGWTDLQFFTLCVLTGGILLHVMLHWSWVCGVVANWARRRQGATAKASRDTSSSTIWGVALLIVICNVLGIAIAAAVLTVQGPLNP